MVNFQKPEKNFFVATMQLVIRTPVSYNPVPMKLILQGATKCRVHSNTVWKFHDFSVTQILREINFGECRSSKNAKKNHKKQNSEPQN